MIERLFDGLNYQEMENVLSEEQQRQLNDKKIELRVENERYLRNHPELKDLVSGFVLDVLTHQPENIPSFAAGSLFLSQLVDS
eukprot:m.76478 g.76478  ORF g.76478 m.76478 type:complete len:83 (+) comp11883_c1_seq2:64-312(+)